MTFEQNYDQWLAARGDKFPPEILKEIRTSMKRAWDFHILVSGILKTGNIDRAIRMTDAFRAGKTVGEIGAIQ